MYVLTTPVRDELEGLPALVAAMDALEPAPALWLVVDDGSTDGSRAWLDAASAGHRFLDVVSAPEPATEYLGAHVARIKRWGLSEAVRRAAEGGVVARFAGVLDADIEVPPDHYGRLLEAFAQDELLGVASSIVASRGTDGVARIEDLQRDDLPRGGTQFFRVACLDSIGGLPPFPGFDGAANVKARLRGWRCRLLTDLVAVQRRETASRFGVAAGYARKGRYAWFLGHHPALVLARATAYAVRGPRAAAVPFLRSWLHEARTGGARCPDPEIRDYYGRERLREYLRRGGGGAGFARR